MGTGAYRGVFSKLPLDDDLDSQHEEPEKGKKKVRIVERSHSVREYEVFDMLRYWLAHCSRKRVEIAETHVARLGAAVWQRWRADLTVEELQQPAAGGLVIAEFKPPSRREKEAKTLAEVEPEIVDTVLVGGA
jgi:hypothetical protein